LNAFQTLPGCIGARGGFPDPIELELLSTALLNPVQILWAGVWIKRFHALL
jgi:hypothetical protein